MPIDKERVNNIFDKFVDDKFSDAEESLKDEFIKARNEHFNIKLGLESEEEGEEEEENGEKEDKKNDKKKDKKKKPEEDNLEKE